jgi:hypothetical protein
MVLASAGTKCVAPNVREIDSLAGCRSTAMIGDAPQSAAPCRMLRPTPPAPYTTTLSPGRTAAVYNAAPTPVATAQPTNAAAVIGVESGSGMQAGAGTTAYSAKAARPQ